MNFIKTCVITNQECILMSLKIKGGKYWTTRAQSMLYFEKGA